MHKAIKSFSGLISMRKGEVRDLKEVEKHIIKDLLEAGYIEEVKKEAKKETKTAKK
jgi:hypothetical protein